MTSRDAGSEPREAQAGRGARDPIPVLFANNYDMARARAGWRAGTYPAHHLYGTAQLGGDFEVVDLPFHTDDRLARATELTRRRLGDIGQQFDAARSRRPGSVVYAAAAPELRSLAVLRAARVFATPIVGVFHSAPSSRLHRWSAPRGFDRVIALSEHTRRAIVDCGVPPERVSVLGWGADLDFAGFAPREPAGAHAPVVATGKTGRDMRTLLAALRATGLPARIYGDRGELGRAGPIPAQVTIRPVSSNDGTSAPMKYDAAVMDDLRSAAVVAIPLADTDRLTGLTEVVDVLACGRPMILTRAPYFDCDIEEIGCGWWVEPGDVRGWSELLTAAMANRDRLDQMGRAGRAWAQRHLNAELFTAGLRRVLLDSELSRRGRGRRARGAPRG
ncbi:MAG TPA: glycosyltransferase [Solirubrobacteraceae bacterium]|nr:glycosyltransferase [Solirubrobacteraceae bacterium]